MTEVEKLEAQMAQLEEKRRQVDLRLREARNRANAEDRKGRGVAEETLGGMLLAVLGDWKAIDVDALDSWLKRRKDELLVECVGESLDVRDAVARYRAFNRARGTIRSARSRKDARTAESVETGEPDDME